MDAFVARACRGKPTTPARPSRAPFQCWTVLGGGDLGLFTTDDGGETFALQSFGSAVRDIVWLSDSIVVLALEDQGVALSTDGGASWTFPTLPSDLESVGRIQLAAESWNGRRQRDTLYAVAGHDLQQNFLGFWRSADAGVSWEAMSTKASGPNLLGVAVDGTDNLGQAFWDLCLEVNPNNAEHVLVGGINLWSTMDGGQSWTCELHWQGASSAHRTHADQHDLLWLDNGDVVVSNDGGVFRWDDSGVSDLSAGLQITQAYALGMHPTQPGQLCWALKTTARLIKRRCTRHVCWTETDSIASSVGTPRTPCTPRRTTDCCIARPTEEGP